ncbi:hypothetical protein GF325_17790 [Candidatus Bathyarchaeota archaeon]|nr:hypothetical protein [Candidatus Bathyarchaeota archaeon]
MHLNRLNNSKVAKSFLPPPPFLIQVITGMTRNLTHKERILAAVNHEKSDQVPTYGFKVEPGFTKAWDQAHEVDDDNWVQFRQDQTILVELGVDGTTDPGLGDRPDPEFDFEPFFIDDDMLVGPNGRVTKIASGGRHYYQDGYWTSLDVREQFPPKIPQDQAVYDEFEKFYKREVLEKDKIFVFPIINGFHEGIWLSIGYVAFAKEIRKPTGLLDSLVDELFHVNMEICKRILDIDSEIIIAFTDDIAYKGNLLLSPRAFRRFYAPRYKQMFDYIHKRGGKTMIHTDGDISPLLPDYVDIGLDLLQGLEPIAGVDIIELNEKYGDDIAWNGNIDVSRLLWKGTPAQVREQCKKVINAVAPSNNLVFGPSTDIMSFHSVENIKTLYETARDYDMESHQFNRGSP